jgi:hypothetical protein
MEAFSKSVTPLRLDPGYLAPLGSGTTFQDSVYEVVSLPGLHAPLVIPAEAGIQEREKDVAQKSVREPICVVHGRLDCDQHILRRGRDYSGRWRGLRRSAVFALRAHIGLMSNPGVRMSVSQNSAAHGRLDCDQHIVRRGRDSNPRYPRRVQRFSRPPHSTTLAPLRLVAALPAAVEEHQRYSALLRPATPSRQDSLKVGSFDGSRVSNGRRMRPNDN